MGHARPTTSGIAHSLWVGASCNALGVYGELRRTCSVDCCISTREGGVMKEIEPSKVPSLWWGIGPLCTFRGELDCAGKLARERSPLPLATYRVRPSRLVSGAVGTQPTGRNPSIRDSLTSAMFMTATSLLSALATNNVLPSGETATASGALPSGESG